MSKIKYIFFDIDGTLTEGELTSWDYITVGLGLDLKVHHDILKRIGENKISIQQAIDELSTYWRSTKNATKESFCEIFKTVAIRKDAINSIAQLRLKGYKSILLSGSLDFYGNYLSNQLKTDDNVTTSQSIWNDSEFISFKYKKDQSKAKLNVLNKYLSTNKINVTECAIVGNGDNDIDVFNLLPLSFSVSDSSTDKIKEIATHQINSLSELLNYL